LSLLGFNGEEKDPVTGYYFLGNGYRAFNPLLMRFNSPDVLSPFDRGGLNPYTYCLGDPINNVDPTGNSAILRTIKYNLRWLLSKTGIASKNSKEVITSWRATPRDQWVDLLELSHTKKIRYRFDNSKANNQFLSDYNNTIGELGNAQHHSLRPSLKDLDPNAPQDVQFRSVLEHIEHRDYYTGEVIDYDHDRLMLAARYTNDDGVKALPEASTYLKKLNEIRGKKMTKLDERYLYLSKKHINSNRDW
jgi:RHS repeat-associated protein